MIKIINIEAKKKALLVTFSNEEKLTISVDTRQDYFLYIGKQLTTQEIAEIVQYDAFRLHFNYILRVLSRGIYTTFEVKEKLRKKDVSEETITEIVTRLKEMKMLDDETYAKEKVAYLINHKHASKKQIINELKKKGINHFLIEDILTTLPDFEVKEIHAHIPKLIKRYENESLRRASQRILQRLYALGFKSENIQAALNHYNLEDYIDEDENLRRAASKVMNRLVKKPKFDPKVVYNILRKAGYPDSKIRLIIKEHINED